MIPKEKQAQEIPKGGKTLKKVIEEDLDSAASPYSPKTSGEEIWGPANQRRGHSRRKRESENDWEYVDGTRKWKKSPKPDEKATINGETRKLGFWEFAEWTYVAVLTQEQGYVQFMLGETNAQFRKRKGPSVGFDARQRESHRM